MDYNKKLKCNTSQNEKENRGENSKIPRRIAQQQRRNALGIISGNGPLVNGGQITSQKGSQTNNEHATKKDVKEHQPKIIKTESKRPKLVKPDNKIALENKSKHERSHYRWENIFAKCLYSTEYFMDNYKYMLGFEKNFIFLKCHLEEHIDVECRTATVNWLIQQSLHFSQSSLFKAIRMMDHFLCAPGVGSNPQIYKIVAITSIWIANKMYGTNTVRISKLRKICGDDPQLDTTQKILAMEKEILKYIKFNVNYPDPADFLYYHLCQENLQNDKKIWFSAMFLLETSTLSLEFSSAFPSLLAASALYLVLRTYCQSTDCLLKHIDSYLVKQDIFKVYVKQLRSELKKFISRDSTYVNVTEKYYKAETSFVAQYFVK